MNAKAPSESTAAYKVAALLMRHGAMTIADICTKVDLGLGSMAKRRYAIERRVEAGWFQMDGDRVMLTEFAKAYMAGRVDMNAAEPAPKYVGQIATSSQINMLTRPPYKSPRRVVRADVPAWSVRAEGFGFKALSGACGVMA
jgi:hypothetical protein